MTLKQLQSRADRLYEQMERLLFETRAMSNECDRLLKTGPILQGSEFLRDMANRERAIARRC